MLRRAIRCTSTDHCRTFIYSNNSSINTVPSLNPSACSISVVSSPSGTNSRNSPSSNLMVSNFSCILIFSCDNFVMSGESPATIVLACSIILVTDALCPAWIRFFLVKLSVDIKFQLMCTWNKHTRKCQFTKMSTGLSRYRYLSCLGTTVSALLVKKCSTVATITGWQVKSTPDASPLALPGFGTI